MMLMITLLLFLFHHQNLRQYYSSRMNKGAKSQGEIQNQSTPEDPTYKLHHTLYSRYNF